MGASQIFEAAKRLVVSVVLVMANAVGAGIGRRLPVAGRRSQQGRWRGLWAAGPKLATLPSTGLGRRGCP